MLPFCTKTVTLSLILSMAVRCSFYTPGSSTHQEERTGNLDALELFCGVAVAWLSLMLTFGLRQLSTLSESEAVHTEAILRGISIRCMDINISETNNMAKPYGFLLRG